jgi:phosphoglycerate dehydrogenase-like enzyme
MKKYKAVYLDYIAQDLHQFYGMYATSDIAYDHVATDKREEMLEKAKDADFYLISGAGYKMDRELIDYNPKVKLIHHQGVGFDVTDVEYASVRNIPVCTTPVGTVPTVAEHVVMLMLAVMRQLVVLDVNMRNGKFNMWDMRANSYSLLGKTVGIIGFGRIGREVARRLRGFDVTIVYYDRFVSLPEVEQRTLGVRQIESLDELARVSDVVTLHMPLTKEDVKSINRKTLFDKMKPASFFINAARGKLIDEMDLYEVLKEKKIAGAAVDAWTDEPIDPKHPILTLRNIVVTPHVAGGTREAQMARGEFMFQNCQNFVDRKPLVSCINHDKIKLPY